MYNSGCSRMLENDFAENNHDGRCFPYVSASISMSIIPPPHRYHGAKLSQKEIRRSMAKTMKEFALFRVRRSSSQRRHNMVHNRYTIYKKILECPIRVEKQLSAGGSTLVFVKLMPCTCGYNHTLHEHLPHSRVCRLMSRYSSKMNWQAVLELIRVQEGISMRDCFKKQLVKSTKLGVWG